MNREQAKQEIKNRYAEYLKPAKKAGTYICPLCGNGTGSTGDGMSIDPHGDGQHLKCFKCGFYGDVIELYKVEHNSTTQEAFNALYKQFNIQIDNYTTQPAEARTEPHRERQTHANAMQEPPTDYMKYFSECANRLSNSPALEYLNARGISEQTAGLLFIGADPKWRSPKALRNGKNPPASPRLIIPTSKSSYLARDIRSNLTESEKKCAKMKEGETSLYQLNALHTDEEQPVFITEGELDAASIYEVGGQAVGLGSTSNYKKLIEHLKKHPIKKPLILCLDNDEAGKKATKSLAKELQELNISYITANISGEYKDPNEALTKDRAGFIKAVERAERKATKPDNVGDYLQQVFKADIEDFKNSSTRKTGFEHLDYKTGGLYSGLYVVGAISSLGKTTFIHQIADQLAAAGEQVLFFSLEQSRFEMVSKSLTRIIARHNPRSVTTSLDIRKGTASGDDLEQAIKEYSEKIGNRLSIIEGNFNCNISFIGEYVKRYIERNGVKPVVIIDYLQILDGEPEQKQTTKDIIDTNVRELKRMSRNLNIPVIVISSLNRSNYLTPVDFESFKESGGIEYTADVIWGLQLDIMNDNVFNAANKVKEKRDAVRKAKAENPRKINLVCLKNRYGRSSFISNFVYYPATDLYKEAEMTGQPFLSNQSEYEEIDVGDGAKQIKRK